MTIQNKLNTAECDAVANDFSDAPETHVTTAQDWFAQGTRIPYDPVSKRILNFSHTAVSSTSLKVFRKISSDAKPKDNAVWTTFLPGWPDGSYGWSKANQHLKSAELGPRLFVEYIGAGDSDKPSDYSYSTDERADLVEAHWKYHGVKSTFIVGFDYSSIVALELLSRQIDRRAKGEAGGTKITGVLLINGGLFADGHTHPWFTTPLIKSVIGEFAMSIAQRSRFLFREIMNSLWSKEFSVTDAEVDALHDAIGRRNGTYVLNKTAGFVDHHKRNSARLNLKRIFMATQDSVSFHVVGSDNDPFEGQQAQLARKRLGHHGLDVRILPGGHLTTSEHPELLADIIKEVASQ